MTLVEIKTFLETACGYNGVAELNEEQGFVHLANDFLDMISTKDAEFLVSTLECEGTDKGVVFYAS